MSLLDDDIEKQADINLKAWEEEQKRKQKEREYFSEYFSEYTWKIDGEKVKFGNNDFHLSEPELDFGYKVYRF